MTGLEKRIARVLALNQKGLILGDTAIYLIESLIRAKQGLHGMRCYRQESGLQVDWLDGKLGAKGSRIIHRNFSII